jgi:hypothetical protein
MLIFLKDVCHHQEYLFVDDVSNRFIYVFNESKDIETKCSFQSISSDRKKIFEKIVDVLIRREPPTMFELGLQFFHVYDGKFNYREGHTVSNS